MNLTLIRESYYGDIVGVVETNLTNSEIMGLWTRWKSERKIIGESFIKWLENKHGAKHLKFEMVDI